MSPAQASHSAAGISAIEGWTVSVIWSPVLAIGRSGKLEHRFDLDRDAERQRGHSDRGAGMLSRVAENLDHQVRGAVDHLRHVDEPRHAVDKTAEAQHLLDPVEVAAARVLHMREDVERA